MLEKNSFPIKNQKEAIFIHTIPSTPSGKQLKRVLKDGYAKQS